MPELFLGIENELFRNKDNLDFPRNDEIKPITGFKARRVAPASVLIRMEAVVFLFTLNTGSRLPPLFWKAH